MINKVLIVIAIYILTKMKWDYVHGYISMSKFIKFLWGWISLVKIFQLEKDHNITQSNMKLKSELQEVLKTSVEIKTFFVL